MKNYVQSGLSIPLVAAAAVISGAFVKVGVLVGIAGNSAAIGEPFDLHLDGVYDVPKTSAQAWTVGAAIYFDPTNEVATTATTAGNILIGAAVEAAANPSATGRIRLNGSAPAAVTT